MSDPTPFETIQRWMQAVVTHPQGIRVGLTSSEASHWIEIADTEIEQVILPSSRMSSLERLGIYGRAYFSRLLECLQVQFPAVRQALGHETFDGLAFGYLVSYPSRSYTLSMLGRNFESYLKDIRPERSNDEERSEPDFADFVIELLRLEQIYSEVFDGPGPEQSQTLAAKDLEGLTAEVFAGSRLRFHPCVRLQTFQFPVHEYATEIRRGLTPTVPETRAVFLVVTRRDYIVRRYELRPTQFQLLSAINEHKTVGEALQCAWEATDQIDPAEIRDWFQTWSAAPLFSEIIC